MITHIRQIESFTEQLFPSIFRVGRGRVGRVFRAVGVQGIPQIVFRVDASRRGIENLLHSSLPGTFEGVEIDDRRVVHHSRIMFSGKDIPCPAHLGCQLINFVDALDCLPNDIGIAQITHNEFVNRRF